MNIKLFAIGNKKKDNFVFPALPESVKGSYGANYQSYEIISKGTVKVPKGTETAEISWEGEFFGPSKKNEAIVKKANYKKPQACVKKLKKWMEKGTVLNLVVTGTWINIDATISSFECEAYGAYGNIRYSISFTQAKELTIKTVKESKKNKGKKKKKTKTRKTAKKREPDKTYVIKSGDTLWGIASKKLGSGTKWTTIYSKNKSVIESAAKKHGRKSSDRGHWIYPGTKLTIPS